MKEHHPIILGIAKFLFRVLRAILSLRYRVEVKGSEVLKSDHPKLILPNHQGIIDPIILFSQLYKYTQAVPILTSSYYDLPIAKSIFSAWGAVRVSDLESGSRNVKVLDQIVESVEKGFDLGKNIVLYPSGQIAGQGYEKIFNKQSAHKVVSDLPDNVEVIGARFTGLWGSSWSKAWMGQSPKFIVPLLKGIIYTLANLIFFMPRRTVTIELVNITQKACEKANKDRNTFNRYLEDFYNLHGEEAPNYMKYFFYGKQLKRTLPSNIVGSVEEAKRLNGESASQTIPADILSGVSTCIASILEISTDKIQAEHYLQLDLGADSLNLVEIVSEVENQFPKFAAPQINEIKTVADLCLVAMGRFHTDDDLKPSDLNQPLTTQHDICIDTDKTILQHFIETFTNDVNDPFTYDAMIGSTNRRIFFLKACVVAELLKKEVKEERVGIMLPALQSTTLLIAACYLSGKIPVMLNWTVGKKVLEHCMETTGVKQILSAGTFISKIEEQLPDSIKNKLILLEQKIPTIGVTTKLKGLLKSKLPKVLINPKHLPETAVILFTSGSEALPKAVPLSHKNIVSDLSAVFQMARLSNNETFLSFLPPFHSFGFTVLSILPLLTGVKVAYTPNPTDAREVLRILKHVQANMLIGTPGFLKLLMAEGSAYHFKSVRYAISGAEAMPPAVKEQFERLTKGALILEGYGITECAPVLTLNPQDKQKLNSVGKFLPGIDHIILDTETNQAVETGQAGMIYVMGTNVFDGYLNEPDLHPFESINGVPYYKTGDLGYMDEEGFLFITGRLKRFIKIAGEMISLPFIEKILLDKYGEEDRQVLAVEGTDTTTPPRIALFTEKSIDLAEANDYLLKNGVAPIAKLKEVIPVDEIPVLGTGKTDYKVLKKQLEK
ncbi:MAG: AMP-binding protein [Marinilabiliaceae bacterium]|nr:AMP-binding protein [Marinilabiliaceae bacterium]